MLDCKTATIKEVSVHHVGNKTHGEGIHLSKAPLDISDKKLDRLLYRFFFSPFKEPEFYHFVSTTEDFTLNPLFRFASDVFTQPSCFHETSVKFTKHLHEISLHPQIKSGDVFVAYFRDIGIGEDTTDAIGIFKSENRQPFLTLDNATDEFTLKCEDGINIEKLDKACLIINHDDEMGYRVCVVDKSNKSEEAQFWKDGFLQLRPCDDDFHSTKDFLDLAKNFVKESMPDEFDVSKADQIDLLNRSVDYFKTRKSFNKNEFEGEVFKDPEFIDSFQQYEAKYKEMNDLVILDDFEVSQPAVKKQSKIFKSVLKLDKNFSIYIHGDKSYVERGQNEEGRKFYKFYYDIEE